MSADDKQDLVAVSPSSLHVGDALRFSLRDEHGRMLLAKGLSIDSLEILESLQRRKLVYVSYDESDEAIKVMMTGLTEATRRDAPLKDIDKYVNPKPEDAGIVLSSSLSHAWEQVETRLKVLLSQLSQGGSSGQDAVRRLNSQIAAMQVTLLHRDRDAAVFFLIHRAVTGFSGYSALHSLLTATVAHMLAVPLKLTPEEDACLVRAALTMNVAMTQLQDLLAAQKHPPSPQQRTLIDRHPTDSARLLMASGVTDPLWLEVVQTHHDSLPHLPLAQRTSAQRLTKILQVVDRYTAAMSPRSSRAGRDAKDAARSAIVQAGAGGHDEVGLVLTQVLGLHPAGTFVKLASGETAVVLRRGFKPNEPWVASVLNKRDEPIAEPRVYHTAKPELAVVQGISGSRVRVRLNPEVMLRQLAFSKTEAERGARLG